MGPEAEPAAASASIRPTGRRRGCRSLRRAQASRGRARSVTGVRPRPRARRPPPRSAPSARRRGARRAAGSNSARIGRRKQRRVDGAGAADGQRADRNAGRHLHDREQRIMPVQRLRLDRHAKHRKRRQGCDHARQMRRAAGARDDHLEARRLRALGEIEEPLRRAMRGDDLRLEADLELLEDRGGMAHRLPIGLAAHNDGDGFCGNEQKRNSGSGRRQRHRARQGDAQGWNRRRGALCPRSTKPSQTAKVRRAALARRPAPRQRSEIMLTLFSYPELFGVADNNPYGLKIFAFLKLCGLPFRHQHIFDASAAPRGQLPYIDDDGEIIGDSDRIIAHLIGRNGLTIDDRADRAAARRRPDDPAPARRSLLGDVLFALARRRLLAFVQGRNPQDPRQCERGEP